MSTNINIDFEKIQVVIDYIVNTDVITYDDIIKILVNKNPLRKIFSRRPSIGMFTQEEAEDWVKRFIQVISEFLGTELNIDSYISWIKNQSKIGKDVNIITDQVIGMFGSILSNANVVTVYKNGKLYKEFAPLNIARINFKNISVTFNEYQRIIQFKYRDKNYTMKFEDTPQKFKDLYLVKLVLNGNAIPTDLENLVKDSTNINIKLNDLNINLDLTKVIDDGSDNL